MKLVTGGLDQRDHRQDLCAGVHQIHPPDGLIQLIAPASRGSWF